LWRRTVGLAFLFLALIGAWYLIKLPQGLVPDHVLPSPVQTSKAFHRLRIEPYAGATLGQHLAASVARLAIAFPAGWCLGFAAGRALATAPLARTVFDPLLTGARLVPAVVVAPVVIRWSGSPPFGIVVVVTLLVAGMVGERVAAVHANTLRRHLIGGTGVDGPGWRFEAARAGLVLAWGAVLTLETIVSGVGLGPLVWSAQSRVDIMLVGIGAAGLVVGSVDLVLRLLVYRANLRVLSIAAFDNGWQNLGDPSQPEMVADVSRNRVGGVTDDEQVDAAAVDAVGLDQIVLDDRSGTSGQLVVGGGVGSGEGIGR
jgi:ABC-type nitrate/sulfonate/bicarbonate transport system permease component